MISGLRPPGQHGRSSESTLQDTKSENNRHLTTKWNLRNGAEQARNIEAAWGQLLPAFVAQRQSLAKNELQVPQKKIFDAYWNPNGRSYAAPPLPGTFVPHRNGQKKKRSNAHEIWTSKIEAVGTLEIANGSCPQGCCTLLNFIEPESEMEDECYRF